MHKLLIVEDNSRLAELMEKSLRKHGFATVIARDGEAALQQVQNEEFDLILLDIHLPCKDGWKVVKELRDQGWQFPIIVVSASSDIPETIREGGYEVDGYILHPFTIPHLVAQVQGKLRQG